MSKIKFFYLIGFFFICSACTNQAAFFNTKQKPFAQGESTLQARIRSFDEVTTPSVSIEGVVQTIELNRFKIRLILNNPQQRFITSTRNWLAYNPQNLKVIWLDSNVSVFDLGAPGEEMIDAANGLIKIGRSLTWGVGTNASQILVAELIVEKLTPETAVLDFYDYQISSEGHNTVNLQNGGEIYNILKKPSIPGIILGN